jgi:glycosyltransferase involved in cell wall biosynthesis
MSVLRLGLVVGRNETWSFIQDLYEDWQQLYQVDVFEERTTRSPFFKERLNDRMLRTGLTRFIAHHDVVFFEWASHLLTAATHMPKICGIVTRLHRYEMYEWVDKINWNAVDKIILVSEAKRREFIEKFPNQYSKTVVIPAGVSLDKFRPHTKTYNGDIGILCYLTPRKRVYDLLISFYDLLQKNNNFNLHIAGGKHPTHGDYYFALRDTVQKLGLNDKVTFYGAVEDSAHWYKNIDIFVSNSYSEGLQVAPMEAMASGCYCLSHSWAGAEELLPQENIFITSQELNQNILDYAESSHQSKAYQKQRMREIVLEKFDIDVNKAKVREVVESAGR